MDIATIVGLILTCTLVLMAMLDGGTIDAFINVPGLLIVVGGTLGATLTANPLQDVIGSIKVFMKTLLLSGGTPQDLIQTIVGFAETARREGILALESAAEEAGDDFLAGGIKLAVDGTEPDLIMAILETELEYLESRHKVGAEFFTRAATAAPAFGMAGTLVGLVIMLGAMDDPAAIGPSMAIALLTTLYGSLIANVFLDPFAAKLKTYSAQEILTKRMIIEGIMSIQSGDNPRIVEQKLAVFLSPTNRPVSSDGDGE